MVSQKGFTKGKEPMMDLEKAALGYVDAHSVELFSLLAKLIGFDTQNYSSHGNEKACQEYIYSLCREAGWETAIYSPDSVPGILEHPEYLPGRGLENRPNVTCTYEGGKKPGVMLAAHTDTVPIGDPKSWEVDPLGGVIRDGKLFGRGAGDDKCGEAAALFVFRALSDLHVTLEKNLLFTAYVDEEGGGGDGALASCLQYPCETYVNLDGGNYEIWNAGLGGCVYDIALHLTFPTDNAECILDGLECLRKGLKGFAAKRRAELHTNPLYAGSDMERSAFKIIEASVGDMGVGSGRGHLTFVVFTDKGEDVIREELAAVLLETGVVLQRRGILIGTPEKKSRFFTYLECCDLYGAVADLQKAASEVAGRPVPVRGACLSDLSVFLSAGSTSSFNFGIFRDFSAEGGAHQPNEYIECNQFLQETKALLLFIIRHCNGTAKSV
jgi:acetylornithine deacetylase/succinyl-diaminopimelate desuccinylase-like protein